MEERSAAICQLSAPTVDDEDDRADQLLKRTRLELEEAPSRDAERRGLYPAVSHVDPRTASLGASHDVERLCSQLSSR